MAAREAMGKERIKVAIVGGGCAAMSAAFDLTRPEQGGRYDVTVYQLGWRLGGKGASGRGVNGRIEEHGLHLWLGYYDNAFRMMRDCYAELGRDPRTSPMADWTDAFKPDPHVGLMDRHAAAWRAMVSSFPAMPGLPGDPYPRGMAFSLVDYLRRGMQLLHALLVTAQSTVDVSPAVPSAPDAADRVATGAAAEDQRAADAALLRDAASLLKYGQLATFAAAIHGVGVLEALLARVGLAPTSLLLRLLDAVRTVALRLLEPLLDGDRESRLLWEVVDLVLTLLRGSVEFGLLTHPDGLDAINDYDTREWLRRCGASERALDSAFVRGLYDLAFAYVDGDVSRPALAAGQGIRGGYRMFFGYRGALFWKMQAGMGDVVFAPLYEVLSRRGVRFRFFHRLEQVRLVDPARLAGGEKPYVTRLEFDVQARIRDGADYRPLVDVGGLPCWPAAPDFAQLEDGERMRAEHVEFESFWDRRKVGETTLEVGRDFDFVVLGVSLGTIPHVCGDILARDERWRTMVREVRTTATQAFQLWLQPDIGALGWPGPSANISAFVDPFDTWADMTHLVDVEQWPRPPGAIAYFCSVLPWRVDVDGALPDAPWVARAQVRQNVLRYLEEDVRHLWPASVNATGSFRWELLCVPDAVAAADAGAGADGQADAHTAPPGEARMDAQFWTANVNPGDLYVLSLPGTLKHRISPLDGTYDNLTIAGDWTDCGYNIGCVEAAVMSGRLASHALSTFPRLEDIQGYDHP